MEVSPFKQGQCLQAIVSPLAFDIHIGNDIVDYVLYKPFVVDNQYFMVFIRHNVLLRRFEYFMCPNHKSQHISSKIGKMSRGTKCQFLGEGFWANWL